MGFFFFIKRGTQGNKRESKTALGNLWNVKFVNYSVPSKYLYGGKVKGHALS